MADAVAVNDCCFRWDIHNPFLPWKDMEATFYQGSPTVTQWKVTLHPMNRGINYWRYSLSLEFMVDDRPEVLAERILLSIELNGLYVTDQEVRDYRFCGSNRCKYYFRNIFLKYTDTKLHHLEIKLEISLPGTVPGKVVEDFAATDACLKRLSSSMDFQQGEPIHPNLYLLSRNGNEAFPAHSYMLHARWDNFFRVHAVEGLHPNQGRMGINVQTNISDAVLRDVLRYIYSATFRVNWPHWKNAAYTTELFKVIDLYKLYHLYKVFVKSDLQQVRVTRNPGNIESRFFPLEFINDRQINNSSTNWGVESSPELTFKFIVRNENGTGPWLSYSLKSTSSSIVYANVNLAIIKMRNEDREFERPLPFHDRDFTIEAEATVESRRVLFLGCPETFGDSDGTEIKYCIRCFLNVTDGTAVEQIRCVEDDTLQNQLARFNVLSDHLHQLREQGFGADVTIRSCSDDVEDAYEERVHKGIFASRIAFWYYGVENLQFQDNTLPDIPQNTRCNLSASALPLVLDYVYTGKILDFPDYLWEEVFDFANQTSFSILCDLIIHLRNNRIPRRDPLSSSDDDYYDDVEIRRINVVDSDEGIAGGSDDDGPNNDGSDNDIGGFDFDVDDGVVDDVGVFHVDDSL